MLTADQTIWDESISLAPGERPFTKRDMIYVNDQNNGSYSGQIQFDCSSLANSNQYLSYSEAYFQIPIVVSATTTASNTGPAGFNAFSIALKNGYYQFIDSIQVDCNNQNICQLQNNLNLLVNYKLLTSLSSTEAVKLGPSLGFFPDSADSYKWMSGVTGLNGDGYSNNRNFWNPYTPGITGATGAFTMRSVSNENLYRRQKTTTANDVLFNALPICGTGPNSTYSSEGRNYYRRLDVTEGTPLATSTYNWVIMATIRLKDLCDFFTNVPISKGLNLRFTINYNSFIGTYTASTFGVVTTSYTQLSGRTCPVMLPSFDAGNSNGLLADAGVYTVTCNVVGTNLGSTAATNSSLIKPPITQTRLYVPSYKLSPDYESNLLREMPISKIKYIDYYTYTIDSVSASNPFNQILTNGILNPKLLVVIPFVAKGSSGTAISLTQQQSIFDSAPGTSAPHGSISNFQVLLGGNNVFNNNEQYTFEQFMDQFQSVFAINGSKITGFNSGLIGKLDWENAYRFYVADLSRRLPVEDRVPISVAVSGTNNTKVTMSYVCFVLFEKSIAIRTSTGEIVDSTP